LEVLIIVNCFLFYDYVDRAVNIGRWTQPDSCAPPTGICVNGPNPGADCTSASAVDVCRGGNSDYVNYDPDFSLGYCDSESKWNIDYGVLYGPDPANPGDCIRDTDPSDGNITISINPISHIVSYSATANWSGSATVVFTANDTDGGSESATITITVTAVQDAPSFNASAPVQNITFLEDGSNSSIDLSSN